MPTNLIRIFYVSKATREMGKSDVADILSKSCNNNRQSGITGVLCYKAGYFAQILEGEELPVLESYVRIAKDKRHSDLVIITIATTDKQLFKGWSMGCINEDMVPFVSIEDILRLRRESMLRSDAGTMIQRWLKLLETQSIKR